MNQILEVKQIVGKTISKIIDGENELFIKFSDDSFCAFGISDVTEGYGYTRNIIEIDDYPKNETCFKLVELGIISEQAYHIACDEQEIKWEQERKKK